MEMDKETTIELANALTDMLRNSFIDEMTASVLAVLVRCNNCDKFHLLTYDAEEIMSSLDIMDMIGSMMFSDGSPEGHNIVKSACKNIGAQLASTGKEVLAVTMIAPGGEIDLDESIKGDRTEEEMRELVTNAIKDGDNRVNIIPSVNVATFAHPDYYHRISYRIETVGDNDVLLTDKEVDEVRGEGSLYELHETLTKSALFLTRVSGAAKVKSCDPEPEKETVLSGDNEAKFRSIVSRIEASLKIEDVL